MHSANGIFTYTCLTCGDEKTEAIEATGHNNESVITLPTCTTKGYTTHTCLTCYNSYVDSEVDATGHAWNAEEVTCEAGRECLECGTTEEALGHNYLYEELEAI